MLLHPVGRTHDAVATPDLTDGHEAELRRRIARLRAAGNHIGADEVLADLLRYQARHALAPVEDAEPSPAEDIHPELRGQR